MRLEFKETKTNTKRFPWEDFLIYDLINQSQPHQPTTFLGVVVKVKTNPILQTPAPLLNKAKNTRLKKTQKAKTCKKSNVSLQWVSQARQLGRMLTSKDPVGQFKHGLTLPKSKELWKKETIVWYCTQREVWNPRIIKEGWWGKIWCQRQKVLEFRKRR